MKSSTVQILTTVISNTAVLAGVVFLVIELRQNSAIALSQMTQERAAMLVDQNIAYVTNQEISKLMARIYTHFDFDSVTKDEWDQIARHEVIVRTRQRDIWFQFSKGLIDEEVYLLAINSAANRLPLWEWLKIPLPGKFTKDVANRSKEEGFQGSPIRTKFIEWSKDKKSPYEI